MDLVHKYSLFCLLEKIIDFIVVGVDKNVNFLFLVNYVVI